MYLSVGCLWQGVGSWGDICERSPAAALSWAQPDPQYMCHGTSTRQVALLGKGRGENSGQGEKGPKIVWGTALWAARGEEEEEEVLQMLEQPVKQIPTLQPWKTLWWSREMAPEGTGFSWRFIPKDWGCGKDPRWSWGKLWGAWSSSEEWLWSDHNLHSPTPQSRKIYINSECEKYTDAALIQRATSVGSGEGAHEKRQGFLESL